MSLKATTTELSSAIKAGLSLTEGGIITSSNDAFGLALEKTGVTLEEVQKVDEVRTQFAAALTCAVGEAAVDYFKADKKLESVSFETNANLDKVGVTVTREKTFPIPGSDESKTVYGATTTSWKVQGASNKGELKKVRSHIADLAANAYGQ